jgi:hypothetical protein
MQTPISLSTLKLHAERVEELVKELDDLFPAFVATPHDTYETIMFRSGQRSVVEWIKQRISED